MRRYRIDVVDATGQPRFIGVCRKAESFVHRLLGLMGKPSSEEGVGLWLVPCRSIHTFFMRFAIDVWFLNSEGIVVGKRANLRPWRWAMAPWATQNVLEAPVGCWVEPEGTLFGQRIVFTPMDAP